MRHIIFRIQFVFVALLLTACSAATFHVGGDFDAKVFAEKVERGVTTQGQVRSWLGAPTATGVSVETDGQRFNEWTYYFATGNLSNLSGVPLKILQIKYDQQGIVQGYNWSTDH